MFTTRGIGIRVMGWAFIFAAACSAAAARGPQVVQRTTWGASGNVKSPQTVQDVMSGKVKTANAAWWGFDGNDATEALQAAINSGARKVIVPNMGKDWILRPIELAGNQEILFEKGVVVAAKRGKFRGGNDSLFRASNKRGITLLGYGAVLYMQKKDYMTAAYQKAEWRMVLSILSCTDVKILGLTLAGSGGDGIYLGVAGKTQPYNKNILIRDVSCENNYRQGISVISAVNLKIENCVFRNTWGTAPEAGIDFEPNYPEEKLSDCVVRNCRFEDNRGVGIALYLAQLTAKSDPISITFEKCMVSSDRGGGIFVGAIRDDGPSGWVKFNKCTVEHTAGYGLLIQGKSAERAKVTFAKCMWRDVASRDESIAPLSFDIRKGGKMNRQGGAEFAKCTVEDERNRPFLVVNDNGTGAGLSDVKGVFTVKNPNGIRMELGPSTERVDIKTR